MALDAIGIDFGTSAVRGAFTVSGEVRAIHTADGAEEIAAAVAFGADGRPRLGHAARELAPMSPAEYVRDIKTWLVAQATDDVAPSLHPPGGLRATASRDGLPRLHLGGRLRRPSSLAALLLQRMLELAGESLGHRPTALLLAHPLTASAAFDAALLAAATELGVAAVDFVAEPLAAAARLCASGGGRPVFIADVGASHTSVAVVEVVPGCEPVLLHAVSEPVGGDAVTLALVQSLGKGSAAAGLDAGMMELLHQLCEQLKKDLGTAQTAECALPAACAQALGGGARLLLERDALERASAPLLHAVEDCCTRALAGSGLAHSDVELYAIGGGTRSPRVRALIERVLGTRARVSPSASVIAAGAAKLAAARPPPRATSDLRTRASWQPPGRAKPQASAPSAPSSRAPEPRERHGAVSVAVRHIDAGHVRNPTTPAELQRLPVARAARDADLEPISLPLLLLLTGSKRRTGTLHLHMDGAAALLVPFVDGKPTLSTSEHAALCERFKHAAGSYRFEERPPDPGARKPESVLALVVSGLRQLMRGWDEGAMRLALGERWALAPRVTPAQQLRMGAMGLTSIEARIVKFSLHGKDATEGVVSHSGVGPHTALSLLLLLDVFGLIDWSPPEHGTERSLAEEIEARARYLDAANYFQVLGVHWSATGDEVEAAYQKLRCELAAGQPAFEAAPQACRRMLSRVERAGETLRDGARRDAYRHATYPDVDFRSIEDFLDKKQRALQLQNDGAERRRDVQAHLQELAPGRARRDPGKP